MQDLPKESRTASHAFDRLVRLVKHLRSEQGCPWDRKQTMESMIDCLEEEAQEVIDAIEADDMENLEEELGDLLLQVVFYAQMTREQGLFEIGDVLRGLNKKLVHRHPHVFGEVDARTAGEARQCWNEAKASEHSL